MERVEVAGQAINAAPVLLDCPEGSKYEVLEVVFGPKSPVTRVCDVYVVAAGVFYLVGSASPTAVFKPVRFQYQAMVLYAGDQLICNVTGAAGVTWDVMVVFIDVDF